MLIYIPGANSGIECNVPLAICLQQIFSESHQISFRTHYSCLCGVMAVVEHKISSGLKLSQ